MFLLCSGGSSDPCFLSFDELLDHFFKIRVSGTKVAAEPVPAALGSFFTVDEHVELASFAWRANRFNIQTLLDEGHETRDLGAIVLSRGTVNDFDLHGVA